MSNKNQIKRLMLAALLVFAVQFVFAAFTSTIAGHATKKAAETNKYSLKNISSFGNRNLSLGTVKYSFRLKATELGSTKTLQNGFSANSSIEFTKGNTTFIYPYKVKVKVPKFKAPTPSN